MCIRDSFTTNQLLEIIQQRAAVVKEEMEAKLEAKFEAKIEQMETRFEEEKKVMKGAVMEEVMGEVTRTRDLPYEMFCAYQDKWTTPSSTISLASFLADYNNGDRPGGGQGEMDLATGTFTCLTGGYYTISFAAYHLLHLKESTNLFLYHNGERLDASSGWQSNDNSAGAALAIQGGRTLVSPS